MTVDLFGRTSVPPHSEPALREEPPLGSCCSSLFPIKIGINLRDSSRAAASIDTRHHRPQQSSPFDSRRNSGRSAPEVVTRPHVIAARGRSWVVLDSSTASLSGMRPLTGVTNRAAGHRLVSLQASGLCTGAARRALRRDDPRGQRSPLGRLSIRLLDGEVDFVSHQFNDRGERRIVTRVGRAG